MSIPLYPSCLFLLRSLLSSFPSNKEKPDYPYFFAGDDLAFPQGSLFIPQGHSAYIQHLSVPIKSKLPLNGSNQGLIEYFQKLSFHSEYGIPIVQRQKEDSGRSVTSCHPVAASPSSLWLRTNSLSSVLVYIRLPSVPCTSISNCE